MSADERALHRLKKAVPFDKEMVFDRDLIGQSWSWIAHFKTRMLLSYHHSDMLIWAHLQGAMAVDIQAVPPEERHSTELRYGWRLLEHHTAALMESVQLDAPYDPEFGGLFAHNGRGSWQRFGPETLPDGDRRYTTLVACYVPLRQVVMAIDVNEAGRITRFARYEREAAYAEWRRCVEAARKPV